MSSDTARWTVTEDDLAENSTKSMNRRLAMSVAEAALEAGVERDHIYGAIREKRLDARKLGRRTIITYDSLERFLQELPPLQLPPAA